MADWGSYMQGPDYRGLVGSSANAGAAVQQGMDTAFSQGLKRDENTRAWDANTRANNQEGRTQQLFPYLLDEQNYAKAKRGMEMLGQWSDFARDVQTPEEWAHLKDAAKAAGVDTSKFEDDNWLVGKRKLQIMTGATQRALQAEMTKAELALKQAEARKADPYVQLDVNTRINRMAGLLPPDAQAAQPNQQQAAPAQSAAPALPGVTLQTPDQGAVNGVPTYQPPQMQRPAAAPQQTGQIAPGRANIVGTQAAATPFDNLRQVIASLPPQEQAAANAAYAKALRTGDAGELVGVLSKYQSPAATAAQEFGKNAGKQWSDFYHGHQQAASTARQMELVLGQFERSLSATQNGISTGLSAEKRMEFANLLQSIGVNPKIAGLDRQNISQLEVLKSLGSQLTASMAKALQQGEGGGKSGPAARVTDADIRLFTASEPGIDKTPAGNRLLIYILRERNQLQYKLATAARQAQAEFPNDPISAQRAYEHYEEQVYADYEKTRDELYNQAGFGPKAAGQGQPANAETSVRQTARTLGLPDDEANMALQAISQGADPQSVMTRMRERAQQRGGGYQGTSGARGIPQGP